jgi:hypothetical protein
MATLKRFTLHSFQERSIFLHACFRNTVHLEPEFVRMSSPVGCRISLVKCIQIPNNLKYGNGEKSHVIKIVIGTSECRVI